MDPGSGAGRAKFLFDLASPVAYLAAERVNQVLGEVPEWVPVRLGEVGPFRCQEEVAAYREDVERAAARAASMMASDCVGCPCTMRATSG